MYPLPTSQERNSVLVFCPSRDTCRSVAQHIAARLMLEGETLPERAPVAAAASILEGAAGTLGSGVSNPTNTIVAGDSRSVMPVQAHQAGSQGGAVGQASDGGCAVDGGAAGHGSARQWLEGQLRERVPADLAWLADCMRKGVATHHAGLPGAVKELVERAFLVGAVSGRWRAAGLVLVRVGVLRVAGDGQLVCLCRGFCCCVSLAAAGWPAGEVGASVAARSPLPRCRRHLLRTCSHAWPAVLTATSSLAAGVNLPARRVIFKTLKMGRDDLGGMEYRWAPPTLEDSLESHCWSLL